jgi:hypothetical protein
MNRGCLPLSGLGLISLFVFGVTVDAINNPKELTAIPFTPWDFLTYGLMALLILTVIRLVRKRDPRKTLPGKWISNVIHKDAHFRTALRLHPDGNAEIHISTRAGDSKRWCRTGARWQFLDDRTLHLWGAQAVTWKILKLNSWSMITASAADSGFPVHWIKPPKINAKAWLLVAAAVLLPVLFALSLPHSEPSHAIADDPKYVPSNTLRRGRW